VCTVYHRGYFKLPTFFNKILVFLIYSCFFIQFYTVFKNFSDILTKGMKSLSQANTWTVVWFFFKFWIVRRSDDGLDVSRNW